MICREPSVWFAFGFLEPAVDEWLAENQVPEDKYENQRIARRKHALRQKLARAKVTAAR